MAINEPILNGPKRQHFLPEFYLNGFTRDGVLAVFDREQNAVRVEQPKNTGVIGHFYTFEDEEGRKRYELERMLSDFESKAAPSFYKLASGKEITSDERAYLAIFIALAGFRTPDMIDSLKLMNSDLVGSITKDLFADVEQVKEQIRSRSSCSRTEEDLEKEAKDMVAFVKEGNYEVVTNHKWAVGMAIETALHIAPLLAGRNWKILHRDCDNKSFVTSDAPVLLSAISSRKQSYYGVGFGSADAMIVFPLTEACVLVMHGQDGEFKHQVVNSEQIRQCNLAIADRCQRFMIGRDEALVRSLAKSLVLANKKWVPKMQRA